MDQLSISSPDLCSPDPRMSQKVPHFALPRLPTVPVTYFASAATVFRYASRSNLESMGSRITIHQSLVTEFQVTNTIDMLSRKHSCKLGARAPTAYTGLYEMLERTISALCLLFCRHLLLLIFRFRFVYQTLLVLIFSVDRGGFCGSCE
jgi:hypothetical protein